MSVVGNVFTSKRTEAELVRACALPPGREIPILKPEFPQVPPKIPEKPIPVPVINIAQPTRIFNPAQQPPPIGKSRDIAADLELDIRVAIAQQGVDAIIAESRIPPLEKARREAEALKLKAKEQDKLIEKMAELVKNLALKAGAGPPVPPPGPPPPPAPAAPVAASSGPAPVPAVDVPTLYGVDLGRLAATSTGRPKSGEGSAVMGYERPALVSILNLMKQQDPKIAATVGNKDELRDRIADFLISQGAQGVNIPGRAHGSGPVRPPPLQVGINLARALSDAASSAGSPTFLTPRQGTPRPASTPPGTAIYTGADPKTGKGISTEIPWGTHHMINRVKLGKGILSLSKLTAAGRKVKVHGFPNRQLSPAFQETLIEILQKKRIGDLSDLTDPEKEYLFDCLAVVQPSLEASSKHTSRIKVAKQQLQHSHTTDKNRSIIKTMMNRLSMLKGQIGAGNDSTQVATEVKSILKKLTGLKVLTPAQVQAALKQMHLK